MAETRNPRKRNRDKNESKKTIETPPAKKRRISSQKKKSRSKDLTKWTIKDLKRYLKQNGATFQMNKDKAYYVRLATMNRNTQEIKKKESNQTAATDSSKTANRILSENDSSRNEAIASIDSNSSNSDGSNSPNFEVPRRSTPPLPPAIDRTPLTKHIMSDEDELQSHLSPNEVNNNQNMVRDAANPIPDFIATPQSAKSRTKLHRVTPVDDMRVNREFNVQNTAVCDPIATLGPFQDIASFKRIKSNLLKMKIEVRSGSSKYFSFLCLAIAVILMTLCIPYIVTLFVAAPFCDTNSDSVSGRYDVFYGLIPLQNKMECVLCPFDAICDANGSAVCADGYILDDYNKICLSADDDIALAASHVAHEASIVLGKQLGRYECASRDVAVKKEMNENELKQKIADVAAKYFRGNKADKDDESISVESLSSVETSNDEIMKAKKENNEELFGDQVWNYAKDIILANAYGATVKLNGTYSSLREIPSSMKCKMLLLCRYYSEYFERNSNECFIKLAFISIVSIAVLIIVYLRKVSNDSYLDNEAINAANIVLHKLSQQQTFHFSIDQFKRYTMRNCKISAKTWNRTVKYVSESTQIALISEEIDGETRMCWKWKSPVPFVPLC